MNRLKMLVLVSLLLALPTSIWAQTSSVVVLHVDGVINPLSARYLERGLQLAQQQNAEAVIITLDTPGGLESAMREMAQLLLQAPLPTIVYVTPRGARATSAGMFLLLAADVAAMAPATHVGAAHPVPLGGQISEVSEEKATSDAAALIRSIATTRGRNADWAERAVRENLSVTASEAVELNVVDLLADDLGDLLDQLEGYEVNGATLEIRDAVLQEERMNLNERFFHAITDPNIAYVLLSLGTLFVLAELADPGLSVAGVGAIVAYALAFMALGSLSVNWAGVALLALSIALFVVGLLTDTELVVSIVGLIPFVLGSLLLFIPFTPASPATPSVRVSLWLIAVMAISIVGFNLVVLRAILIAARRPPQAGAERLIGQQGVALTDLAPDGQVRVDLEDWSAVAEEGSIEAGTSVRVTGIGGVRLRVVPAQAAVETGSDEGKEARS